MSSDAKSQDILPENNGVVLSDKESAFLKLQLRYHELLDIPANQRTEEEKKEANKLRRPYSEKKAYYPHPHSAAKGGGWRTISLGGY